MIGARVEAIAIPGIPIVQPGNDLAALVEAAVARAELARAAGDVIVVASKLVSRAEGRVVELARVEPSARARELAAVTGHDPAHVEVILRESSAISRVARPRVIRSPGTEPRSVPGVLVARHVRGFVVANAGVDFSNVGRAGSVLLLPADPDASAARLAARLGCPVVISDSFGRPFRLGSVGVAIGSAGVPPLHDHRGRVDLFGRPLEHTATALADQLAALADLVAGQADEARGAVLVRGVRVAGEGAGAAALVRTADEDLYA